MGELNHIPLTYILLTSQHARNTADHPKMAYKIDYKNYIQSETEANDDYSPTLDIMSKHKNTQLQC